MTSKLPLTAIVMTFNEERNLEACLQSIAHSVDEILIVDCGSTDRTLDIAAEFGARVLEHPWTNYAQQFQWALDNAMPRNEWILRLDADERWTTDGLARLADIIRGDSADGVYVRMKIFFMGQWIKHGGFYPNQFLRVFKHHLGTIEQRWMDEHIQVRGRTIVTDIDVLESNYDRQQNLTWWTTKHNNYATREAIDALIQRHAISDQTTVADRIGKKTERKRWIKENVYSGLPLFLRPFLYFLYRFVICLGFLDGMRGFIFHTLHAFWYRFLVDAKIYQIETLSRAQDKSVQAIVKEHYHIDL